MVASQRKKSSGRASQDDEMSRLCLRLEDLAKYCKRLGHIDDRFQVSMRDDGQPDLPQAIEYVENLLSWLSLSPAARGSGGDGGSRGKSPGVRRTSVWSAPPESQGKSAGRDPVDGVDDGSVDGLLSRLARKGRLDCPELMEELRGALRAFDASHDGTGSSARTVDRVHDVGLQLYAVTRALQFDADRQWSEADIWAKRLNFGGRQQFRIFLVRVGESFDAELMSGGTPNALTRSVWSWGVRNSRGHIQCRARVS
jgi:hypothetical protein